MLNKLKEVLYSLPDLLDEEVWDSLLVNRRKPYTYRVFTQVGDLRVCLHRFDPCDTDEAFPHPHPWPAAFKILSGAYEMSIKHSKDRLDENPVDVANFVLKTGAMYEITSPLTWHTVVPLMPTYTVMVNGPAWSDTEAHTSVRRTKGKDLDKMPPRELYEHLRLFKRLLVR